MTGKRGSSSSKKHALVKWTTGPYIDTYTHNVDTDWIVGFDSSLSDYGDMCDESWVIEWRVPPKPSRGWTVYDGQIMDVSVDLDYLKREMQKRQDQAGSSAAQQKKKPTDFDPSSPVFQEAVAAAVAAAMAAQTPRKERDNPAAQANGQTPSRKTAAVTTKKVQVGEALFMDEPIFNMVNHCTSPGTAIGHMLKQAFSRDRLIRSSYAGQKKTIDKKVRQKPSLKKYKKMKDIEYFIKGKFPGLTQSSFCLTVGRYLGPNANSKPEVQYVDTSGSEDES